MNDSPPLKKRILILYSNPKNTVRLRLDKEHREIDQVLKKLNFEHSVVKRLHATSVSDFANVLREEDYDIIQFSGHGGNRGIYLEHFFHDEGVEVSARQIANLLIDTNPRLEAAIFISCFSAKSIEELVHVAPYLISIDGAANDNEAIVYIRSFYDSYLRDFSIEKAFNSARTHLEYLCKDPSLEAVLSRRGRWIGRELIEVFAEDSIRTLFIDVTNVILDAEKLGYSKQKLTEILDRKIKVHGDVLDLPRERAVLSLGKIFGVFSWENYEDVIFCEKLVRIRPDVDYLVYEAFTKLIIDYNDKYVLEYRREKFANPRRTKFHVERALLNHWESFEEFFVRQEYSTALYDINPGQFKSSKAQIKANLGIADLKFHEGDISRAIAYIEKALSFAHDFVDETLLQIIE
ncbi:MAG: hypothetical protein AAFY76_05480 [Cyanobacteria bacterium J06649_11]